LLTSASILTEARTQINNSLTIAAGCARRTYALIGRVALRNTRAIVETRLRLTNVNAILAASAAEACLARAVVEVGRRIVACAAILTRTRHTLIDEEAAVEARVACGAVAVERGASAWLTPATVLANAGRARVDAHVAQRARVARVAQTSERVRVGNLGAVATGAARIRCARVEHCLAASARVAHRATALELTLGREGLTEAPVEARCAAAEVQQAATISARVSAWTFADKLIGSRQQTCSAIQTRGRGTNVHYLIAKGASVARVTSASSRKVLC
jgi:hypothetical protein